MKTAALVAILSALLLIPACGGVPSIGGGGASDGPRTNFVQGDGSVQVSFLDNAPPSEVVFGSSSFGVSLRIENVGQYTIPKNKLRAKLQGFQETDFGDSLTLTKVLDYDLTGARSINGEVAEGAPELLDFGGQFEYKGKLPGGGIQTYPFEAELCYPYETTASTKICIVKNPLSIEDDHACSPSGVREVQNSAAPVKVTNLNQNVGGSTTTVLTFEISKTGPGRIYLESSITGGGGGYNKCGEHYSTGSAKDIYKYKDKVFVTVDTGLPDLRCSGLEGGGGTTASGVVTLSGGKAVIGCTQGTSSTNTDGFKAISLNLKYQVKISTQKTVVVKNLNVFDSSSQ